MVEKKIRATRVRPKQRHRQFGQEEIDKGQGQLSSAEYKGNLLSNCDTQQVMKISSADKDFSDSPSARKNLLCQTGKSIEDIKEDDWVSVSVKIQSAAEPSAVSESFYSNCSFPSHVMTKPENSGTRNSALIAPSSVPQKDSKFVDGPVLRAPLASTSHDNSVHDSFDDEWIAVSECLEDLSSATKNPSIDKTTEQAQKESPSSSRAGLGAHGEAANVSLSIDSLIDTLENDLSATYDVSCALQKLESLSSGDVDDAKNIVVAGGIVSTVYAMRRLMRVARIQQEGYAVLCNLAYDDGSSSSIVAAGGICIILGGMKKHIDSPCLLEKGCAVLSRLSTTKRNKMKMIKADAVSTIIGAMQCHLNEAALQGKACDTLCHLDLHRQSLLSDARGICAVVSAMKVHKDVAMVQEKACALLSILANHSDCSTLIATEGGVSAVIADLEQFVHVPSVVVKALRALKKLSRNETNKTIVANKNGIASTISTMNKYQAIPCIQMEACATLSNLSQGNSQNRMSIAAAGGVIAIFSAMKRHENMPGVQLWACAALKTLATNNDRNKVLIVESNGIAPIVTAMQNHLSVSSIQEEACGLLKTLAINDDHAIAIASCGGVHSIVTAMERHKCVGGVQEMACGAIFNLACSSVGLSFIKQLEPWELLEDAEDEFPSLCGNYVQYVLGNCDQI